jgi:hypothetical protein
MRRAFTTWIRVWEAWEALLRNLESSLVLAVRPEVSEPSSFGLNRMRARCGGLHFDHGGALTAALRHSADLAESALLCAPR